MPPIWKPPKDTRESLLPARAKNGPPEDVDWVYNFMPPVTIRGRPHWSQAQPPVVASKEPPVVASKELEWLANPIARRIIPTRLWDELSRFSKKTTEPLPQMIVAGPGVLWAYGANLIMWLFFVGLTCLANKVSYCPQDVLHEDIARYPTYVWGIFVVVLVVILACELKSLGYVLIPMVQVTKRFRFLAFDFSARPFHYWLVTVIGISGFGHLDVATNALFVATTKKSFTECAKGAQMQALWEETIKQAHLSWLPGVVQFVTVMDMCWLLMLMQAVFAFCDVVPLKPWEVSYDCGEGENTYFYRTVVHPKQNHGAALASLHTVGRMASGTFQAETFGQKKFEQRYNELMHRLHGRSSFSSTVDDELKELFLTCQMHSRSKLVRCIETFGLVGICECGIFLHAQISYAALVCAVSGEPIVDHGQVVFCIVLSLAMAFKRVWEAHVALAQNCKNVGDLHDSIEVSNSPELADLFVSSRQRLRVFMAIYVSYILILIWAVCKVIALVACPHGLWNISSGCVVDGAVDVYPSCQSSETLVMVVSSFGAVDLSILVSALFSGFVKYCKSY